MTVFAITPRIALILAAALLAVPPRPARADGSRPSVVVARTSSCSESREDAALRHALEVELAALHVEQRWEASDGTLTPTTRVAVSADCTGDDERITLRVWTSVPQLVVERSVALRDVPESARARTLALIVSEAVGSALDAETNEPPPPGARRLLPRRVPDTTAKTADAPEPLFTSVDPYAPWGALFTSDDPYRAERPIRVGAAAQARLLLQGGSPLIAFEVAANGPLSGRIDWAAEASYLNATTWTSTGDRDLSWWSAALGFDLIDDGLYSFALGPRLTLGHLTVSDLDLDSPTTESTLVTALGARGKFEIPLGDRASLQTMLLAQRSLGVLALGHYTGLDRIASGWLLSWGVGLAVAL